MYTDPSVDDFKSYFFRDFPYADDDSDLTKVVNQDIVNAMAEAVPNINVSLFTTQTNYTLGFLLISAHFLVTNLRSSSQGIAGQYAWLANSKSVGSVSEGMSIPQRILDNPVFAMLSKTTYGARYLMMVLPNMSGQMFTVCGRTQP